ncbi:hypothetical protein SESBI_21906 [Sesbania bispinosa]|nr:hypothetical protein SESBI_21906 [Sesbania bispinosa]
MKEEEMLSSEEKNNLDRSTKKAKVEGSRTTQLWEEDTSVSSPTEMEESEKSLEENQNHNQELFETATGWHGVMKKGGLLQGCHYLVIQKWKPDFFPMEDELKHVAVWIRILGLPMEFYDRSILWSIGNAIGKTIEVDSNTLKPREGVWGQTITKRDDDHIHEKSQDTPEPIIPSMNPPIFTQSKKTIVATATEATTSSKQKTTTSKSAPSSPKTITLAKALARQMNQVNLAPSSSLPPNQPNTSKPLSPLSTTQQANLVQPTQPNIHSPSTPSVVP